jgi:plasmid stabilization system protein ParE
MKYQLIVSPRTRQDIHEQADYIARRNRAVGRRFYEQAEAGFALLLQRPRLGERVDIAEFVARDIRCLRVPNYENHLIFYRVSGTYVHIIRILHGAQDWAQILRDDPALPDDAEP